MNIRFEVILLLVCSPLSVAADAPLRIYPPASTAALAFTRVSSSIPGSQFGYAIAASGTSIVVGAPLARVNDIRSGAVILYERSGLTYSEVAVLTQSDSSGGAGDSFGRSLAINSEWIVVGAPFRGSTDAGAVYVFSLSGNAPSLVARLEPPNPTIPKLFGSSVALVGDRLFVGAPGYLSTDNGAVYCYSLASLSVAPSVLTAPHLFPAPNRFGTAMVATSTRLVVGSPYSSPLSVPPIEHSSTWNLRITGANVEFESGSVANRHNGAAPGLNYGARLAIQNELTMTAPAIRTSGILASYDWIDIYEGEQIYIMNSPYFNCETGGGVGTVGGLALSSTPSADWCAVGLPARDTQFDSEEFRLAQGLIGVYRPQFINNDPEPPSIEFTYLRLLRQGVGTALENENMGFSLLTVGDSLLAGAPLADGNEWETGLVYVFDSPASSEFCDADFNASGSVDIFDWLDFMDVYGERLCAADFNLDGTIDFFDYIEFVDAFSAGCD